MSGRNDPKSDIVNLVHDWLRDERNEKWLLILDNADDAHWLLDNPTAGEASLASGSGEERTAPLWEQLPQSQHGSILVTTRSRSVALRLVEENDVIDVEPMTEADAVALFETKFSKESDRKAIIDLITALEYMPLAVVQAAAYISQRAPRISVPQYIEKFRTDRNKAGLLTHEAGHLRRDRDAKSSITITWQISFDYIQQERSSATDLLSLMSFFDRQGIPESLLQRKDEEENKHKDSETANRDTEEYDEDEIESEFSLTDDFEDDILILKNYSFIFVNIDTTTFGMHRLVQLATREWLKLHSQLEKWRQRFIKNLCAEFPSGEYENWSKCGSLFPHAKSAMAQKPEQKDSLIQWALLLYNAAWYAWSIGNSSDAMKMAVESTKVRKKELGQEHIVTLNSQSMVALVYELRGRWKEAEKIEVQVVESCKSVLGQEHPDTLTVMSNLASTYSNQGQWKEAEELGKQVLDSRKRIFGQENLDTLTSMNNLAMMYADQGRWEEAEVLQIQVVELSKKVLNPDDPITLTSMSNLALTYSSQRRWKEAEELEIQVLESRKKLLGQEHPNTLTSMSNLAMTYSTQGLWEEAEVLQVQVVELFKKVLGQDHPNTLASVSNLAMTYSSQRRLKEAEELEVQVLESKKKVLGLEHPDTLIGMSNLALTYWTQGRLEEAEELETKALELRKSGLGEEHPNTMTSMSNLAWIWNSRNRKAEALGLMSSCYELRMRKLGPDHPDTIFSAQSYNTWKLESTSI
jgi:tetratricopeptide (TPR) repeat protein